MNYAGAAERESACGITPGISTGARRWSSPTGAAPRGLRMKWQGYQ